MNVTAFVNPVMCSPVLVTAAEMRALEARAVQKGTSEDELMEEAGAGLAGVVRQFWPRPGYAVVFAGKGHNGGDAFVLARHLVNDGWEVEVRTFWPEDSWRPLTWEKWQAVREHRFRLCSRMPWWLSLRAGHCCWWTALLGTGAGGALKEPCAKSAAP